MRLIDADALLEHLEACLQNGRQLSNLYDLSEIVCYVKSVPTIDAVEVKHGEWIEYDNSHCECPFCHEEWSYFDNEVECFNCCPNCGAKMDGEEKNDE